jgi:hypothetical protein
MRPQLPTDNSTLFPRRREQSLTRLAPAVTGAALHLVLPQVRHPELRSVGEVEMRCGEDGNSFILHRFLHRSTSPSSSTKPNQANVVSSAQRQKAPENEAPKRAGATPLFGLQSAQKVFEVAPARFGSQTRHAAGQKSQGFECVVSVQQFSHGDLNESCITACMAGPQEGETLQCQS